MAQRRLRFKSAVSPSRSDTSWAKRIHPSRQRAWAAVHLSVAGCATWFAHPFPTTYKAKWKIEIHTLHTTTTATAIHNVSVLLARLLFNVSPHRLPFMFVTAFGTAFFGGRVSLLLKIYTLIFSLVSRVPDCMIMPV